MHAVSIHQMTQTIAGHGGAAHLGELVRMRAGGYGISRRMTGGLLVRPAIELSDQAWRARLNVSSANLNNESVAGARDAQVQADHADLEHNNVQWLDAKDPAFAAVRLFMDLNQDARVQAGEATSLGQAGVVAIDLTAGQIRHADGHVDALTAQALTGETSGGQAHQGVPGGGWAADRPAGR